MRFFVKNRPKEKYIQTVQKRARKKKATPAMGFLFSKPQAPPRAPQRAPQMRPLPQSEPTRTLRPGGPVGTVGTFGPSLSLGPLGPSVQPGPLGPLGPTGPLGQPVPPRPTEPTGPTAPSGPPLGPTGPQAACCTLQAARCAACTLGTTVDAYCATRGDDARCKVVPAWLTGRVWLGLTARVPENVVKEQLGYTHYTPVWTLLDRPVELNYGTSSQWIQANDGVRDPQNHDLGWPWGSIEGGHLVSRGLGGARYMVAASTHRWDPRSDVSGGFGFAGGALATQYWGRVVLLLLPPHGARRGQALRQRVGRGAAPSFLLFFFFFGGGLPTKKRKTKGPRTLFVWGA